MISYSSKLRSKQLEIMDDFELQGEPMKALLNDLIIVNKWLGGQAITLDGLEYLLAKFDINKSLTVLDVGCGDGEMLRQCAHWASKRRIKLKVIGIDANSYILKEARKRSGHLESFNFKVMDIFSEKGELPKFDIALCTLFIHHFNESQIVQLLKRLSTEAKVGVVINDLHRSRWSFWLFRIFSLIFLKTKIARHDGLVSVASGFKKEELLQISKKIEGQHRIKWKWAFRYQWIIKAIP
ncbi:MAG: methyltransferase domain-containing protein [Bacteroidota bacterium]